MKYGTKRARNTPKARHASRSVKHHRDEASFQAGPTLVPSHERFKHICNQACHQKRQKHAFQTVEKDDGRYDARNRKDDADHSVEGVRFPDVMLAHIVIDVPFLFSNH